MKRCFCGGCIVWLSHEFLLLCNCSDTRFSQSTDPWSHPSKPKSFQIGLMVNIISSSSCAFLKPMVSPTVSPWCGKQFRKVRKPVSWSHNSFPMIGLSDTPWIYLRFSFRGVRISFPKKNRRLFLRRPGPAFEAETNSKNHRTQIGNDRIPSIQVRTVSFREGSQYPLIYTSGPIFRGFRFWPTKGWILEGSKFGWCTGVPPGKVETYPTKREVGNHRLKSVGWEKEMLVQGNISPSFCRDIHWTPPQGVRTISHEKGTTWSPHCPCCCCCCCCCCCRLSFSPGCFLLV